MGGRRRSELLAEELAFNRSVRLGERHVSPHVFERLCRFADEMTTNGDRDGLFVAQCAIRIARRLAGPVRCCSCRRTLSSTKTTRLARGFARLAAALRLRGRHDHADDALELAFRMDPPAEIRGDLHRRRALLRIYQERGAEALADARTGLRLATPGHRRGRATVALGIGGWKARCSTGSARPAKRGGRSTRLGCRSSRCAPRPRSPPSPPTWRAWLPCPGLCRPCATKPARPSPTIIR